MKMHGCWVYITPDRGSRKKGQRHASVRLAKDPSSVQRQCTLAHHQPLYSYSVRRAVIRINRWGLVARADPKPMAWHGGDTQPGRSPRAIVLSGWCKSVQKRVVATCRRMAEPRMRCPGRGMQRFDAVQYNTVQLQLSPIKRTNHRQPRVLMMEALDADDWQCMTGLRMPSGAEQAFPEPHGAAAAM